MQDFNENKDLLRVRSINLAGGNKINVKREDPFGFWTISWERGQLPDYLKGQYTSFEEARKAVEAYLAQKNKQVESITK